MKLIEVLQSSPTTLIIVLTIAGLMVGSFLNVVIYRYPIMLFREWRDMAKEILTEQGYKISGTANEPLLDDKQFNLVVPRSRCPKCQHLIRSWENIPLISYVIQGAKCTQCKTAISLRYPAIELITGILFGFLAWQFGWSWQTLVYLVLSAILVVQIFIDIDHKILPDPLNYILLWLGLFAAYMGWTIPLTDAVLGALFGYLSLWSFYWIFKLATKKEGMGYGDFKLLAALGAFAGYQQLLLIIVLSAGVGAVIGITMMALKKTERSTQIPFGPYLAIAGWISIFWGKEIIDLYLRSSGI
ncbi:MAG: prepilin peptidase [Gammaproteobacteria bacterium]|nr:prepilin peptidase [Gammaproteobacteria bacterium]NVK86502.1 prepilin peptidase [Gammaproteobacteria bacterium]